MRKIDLPDVIFEGYHALSELEQGALRANVQVLNQIADALQKFPEYEIELHGHAVSVLYYDAERSDLEQEETLLPLSAGRSGHDTRRDGVRGVDGTDSRSSGGANSGRSFRSAISTTDSSTGVSSST